VSITAGDSHSPKLLARRDTPDSLRRAAQLVRTRLFRTSAGTSIRIMRTILSGRALDLNPRSSGAWIARGLVAERLRDFAGAAQSARDKPRASIASILPAWTLRKLLFPACDRLSFWESARRAASLAYDDPAPLLTLADRVGRMDRLEPTARPSHHWGLGQTRTRLPRLLIDEGRHRMTRSSIRTNDLERCRAGCADRGRIPRGSAPLPLRSDCGRSRCGGAMKIWNGIGARSRSRVCESH